MTLTHDFDAMFSGIIGQEYRMLKLICPFAVEMSRLVGSEVAESCQDAPEILKVVELGGGTGITTLAILSASDYLCVQSIDNEPTMQDQAKQHLKGWVDAGRLTFCGDDALSALRKLADNSVNIVASAYTLHNFEGGYREQVIKECFRVLKPEGRFINGDRYALDNIDRHTRNIQQEVGGYFKVLTEIDRLDLLEQWIIHVLNDESENHIMRESLALRQLSNAGFQQVKVKSRQDVNALVTAVKC